MVVDFIEAAICKGSSWREKIGNDIYAGEYRNVVGGDMTEELMIGFRVALTCVMRRSRV